MKNNEKLGIILHCKDLYLKKKLGRRGMQYIIIEKLK